MTAMACALFYYATRDAAAKSATFNLSCRLRHVDARCRMPFSRRRDADTPRAARRHLRRAAILRADIMAAASELSAYH